MEFIQELFREIVLDYTPPPKYFHLLFIINLCFVRVLILIK